MELVALTGHLPSELEDGYVAHPLLAGSSAFVTAKRTAMHHASPVPSLKMVGVERVELSPFAPKASVLPLYYTPNEDGAG